MIIGKMIIGKMIIGNIMIYYDHDDVVVLDNVVVKTQSPDVVRARSKPFILGRQPKEHQTYGLKLAAGQTISHYFRSLQNFRSTIPN